MHLGNPIAPLAKALQSACDWHLPDVPKSATLAAPGQNATRRPSADDCQVMLFPQSWEDTGLGFGGGGQENTLAYTVVIECKAAKAAVVYFDGRFAYLVPLDRDDIHLQSFAEDCAVHSLASCGDAPKKYRASLDLPY